MSAEKDMKSTFHIPQTQPYKLVVGMKWTSIFKIHVIDLIVNYSSILIFLATIFS